MEKINNYQTYMDGINFLCISRVIISALIVFLGNKFSICKYPSQIPPVQQ